MPNYCLFFQKIIFFIFYVLNPLLVQHAQLNVSLDMVALYECFTLALLILVIQPYAFSLLIKRVNFSAQLFCKETIDCDSYQLQCRIEFAAHLKLFYQILVQFISFLFDIFCYKIDFPPEISFIHVLKVYVFYILHNTIVYFHEYFDKGFSFELQHNANKLFKTV